MRKVLCLLFVFLGLGAYSQNPCAFKLGYMWRGELTLNDSTNLPFWFKFIKTSNKFTIEIYNAEEVIKVDEVQVTPDSINFKMPVFNSEFRCKWKNQYEEHDAMEGIGINHNRLKQNVIEFSASRRMVKPVAPCSCSEFIGKWEVDFSPNTPDHYKAIGQFKNGRCWDFIYGTFLTETGDYRFLSGSVYSDTVTLSCFDGSHAFYFKAYKLSDGTLKGQFYSGMHWSEPWVAKRNESFELR
ncbi:MAG: TlpA family protein disulfide reductase, partial [Bacteroidetes bacterium]|nr:TlpA family protein disulfide reductase [Bacteroidota bacterium]